jgi:tetratricopeptide (TPR) repeat protein
MALAASNQLQLPRDAQTAYSDGDYCRAEELFRKLCREQPYKTEWRLELASVLIAKVEFAAAERLLEEAKTLAGGNTEVTRQVALAYFRMLRYELAKRLLEPAAATGNEESLKGLVQVLEREGSYAEAAQWVERALKGRSPDPEFRYLEALVLSRQGKNDEAETRSRLVIDSSPALPVEVRYRAAYLLAGILDRSQRYAEAATVLGKAKQEAAAFPGIKNLIKQQRFRLAGFRELASKVRPEEIRRWREEMEGDALGFRPAALMGHPRSGTTLLEHRLEQHDGVVALEETNAFDGGALGAAGFKRDAPYGALYPRATEQIKDARRRYGLAAATLHGAPLSPGNLVIDKNPSQLMQLALWLRVFPELRLLVAVRDPRDVVISSYFLYLPANPASAQFLNWETTARHYAEFMQLWLKMRDLLPPDCWLQCRYEDVVADAASETARVAAFLGIAGEQKEPGTPSATVHSPNYATATRPVHSKSVGRWQHYAEHLKSGAKLMEPFITEFGYPAG